MPEDLGEWAPLSVDGVAELLGGLPAPWWIAGGWAVDLHLGRQTRPHHDIDVQVLRAHLPRVRERLRGWDLHAADPPGAGTLRPWPDDEVLPAALHDVWCRPSPASPWALQLMVADTDGADWLYRRDSRIRRPVSELSGPASAAGRPVIAPEVQLLHKSAHPRPKDVADLHAVVGSLDAHQRNWLRRALTTVDSDHGWLEAL